ncbi:MAG: HAD family hydrolase [Peptococcaceae bacterium]|nr:HAD family hydrolase [Peptococcaceae bacterium]
MTLRRFACAAFDLDGTLLDGHSQLSPRTKHVMAQLAEAGIPAIVASGRPFSTIPREVLALDAVRYVITGNGVRIYDKHSNRDIYHCSLRKEALDEILHVTQYYPVGYELFIAGQAFANRSYLNDPSAFGVREGAYHYLISTRQPIEDLNQFVQLHAGNIDSLGLSMADQTLKSQLWQRLEHEVEGIYVTSSLPRLIEVADSRAGKGSALAVVLECLGLAADELVAFGDADNDLGMLQFAGLGVAMENGADHLKEAADRIAPPHDQDGVAQILEALLKEC